MHIDKICARTAKLCKQKKMNLLKKLDALDPEDSGFVNTIKFEFLMVEKIGLSLKECAILIQVLDVRRSNQIEYSILLGFMANKEKIFDYFERILKK